MDCGRKGPRGAGLRARDRFGTAARRNPDGLPEGVQNGQRRRVWTIKGNPCGAWRKALWSTAVAMLVQYTGGAKEECQGADSGCVGQPHQAALRCWGVGLYLGIFVSERWQSWRVFGFGSDGGTSCRIRNSSNVIKARADSWHWSNIGLKERIEFLRRVRILRGIFFHKRSVR